MDNSQAHLDQMLGQIDYNKGYEDAVKENERQKLLATAALVKKPKMKRVNDDYHRDNDWQKAKLAFDMAKQNVKDCGQVLQNTINQIKDLQKDHKYLMQDPSKRYDVKDLANVRFRDFEYNGFLARYNDDNQQIDNMLADKINYGDIYPFTRMHTGNNAERRGLIKYYQDEAKKNKDVQYPDAKLQQTAMFSKAIPRQSLYATMDTDLARDERQKLDFVEQGYNSFSITHDQQQADEMQVWHDDNETDYYKYCAIAASELRTRLPLDINADHLRVVSTMDLPLIADYLRVQKMALQDSNWQYDEAVADHMLGEVYGTKLVNTGKAMLDDYLTFLSDDDPNGLTNDYMRQQLFMGGNADEEFLQVPRKLDKNKQVREQYVIDKETYQGDPRNQELQNILWEKSLDYYAAQASAINEQAHFEMIDAYSKLTSAAVNHPNDQALQKQYRDFFTNWDKVHNGTDADKKRCTQLDLAADAIPNDLQTNVQKQLTNKQNKKSHASVFDTMKHLFDENKEKNDERSLE